MKNTYFGKNVIQIMHFVPTENDNIVSEIRNTNKSVLLFCVYVMS